MYSWFYVKLIVIELKRITKGSVLLIFQFLFLTSTGLVCIKGLQIEQIAL